MHGISCDMCGQGLLINSDVRYEVKIVVKAAYDPMDISKEDLEKDIEKEIEATIKRLENISEQEAMEQVFKAFMFDLCPACQKKFLSDPLGKSNRQVS